MNSRYWAQGRALQLAAGNAGAVLKFKSTVAGVEVPELALAVRQARLGAAWRRRSSDSTTAPPTIQGGDDAAHGGDDIALDGVQAHEELPPPPPTEAELVQITRAQIRKTKD